MATLRLAAIAGATRVFLTSLGGTGTPDVAGYALSQVVGLIHDATIAGLVGRFYAVAKDGDGTELGYVLRVQMADDSSVIDTTATLDADDTAANQAAILAAVQGAQVIQVPSPNVSGNLVLTQGDTYDGIGNPKAQWNVTTNYTDGWAVVLTIRDKDDAVVYTNAGTVDSATVVSVAIATPTGLVMTGCPGSWQGKFDVQLSKAGSVKTIALGVVYINEDQTR